MSPEDLEYAATEQTLEHVSLTLAVIMLAALAAFVIILVAGA